MMTAWRFAPTLNSYITHCVLIKGNVSTRDAPASIHSATTLCKRNVGIVKAMSKEGLLQQTVCGAGEGKCRGSVVEVSCWL